MASTYIRLWKAHKIGPVGKKIPLSKVNIPANFQIARLSTVSVGKEVCDQFSVVKSRTARMREGGSPYYYYLLVYFLKVVSYTHVPGMSVRNRTLSEVFGIAEALGSRQARPCARKCNHA